MTIEEFVTKAETIAKKKDTYNINYNFFCGLVADYNREKRISDIIILLPPKEWPLNWRKGCFYDVEIEFMIGRVAELRDNRDDTYPYAEIRDELNEDAVTFLEALNDDTSTLVLQTDIMGNYFSNSEGPTVNSQEFLKFPVKVRLWEA
jgi:hypothetical protein